MILNSESLEEVDCFKYLGSQVAADEGCERDTVHSMKRTRGMRSAERRKVNVLEMKCLRSLVGVSRIDS